MVGIRRFVFGAIGAAVAVAAGAALIRRVIREQRTNAAILNETLPVHSKWWRQQATLPGDLLYIALGDSAAQGIGATAPNRGYVGLIAERIAELTGRSVRTVNLSVSGARVEDAITVQLPKLRGYAPDVVTLSIGANDVVAFEPTRFEEALRTIFEALPPHAIVADLPYFYLPRNERTVARANAIVHKVAAEFGLTTAPLYATTRGAGLRGALTLFANDMFHPNDRGYRLWADAFRPALQNLLLPNATPTATHAATSSDPPPAGPPRNPTPGSTR